MAYVPTETVWVNEVPGDPSTRLTAISAEDLNNFDRGLIATNADLAVLNWNGSTYAPVTGDASLIGDTSKRRMFIGPVDPATIPGVVLTDRDLWAQYT